MPPPSSTTKTKETPKPPCNGPSAPPISSARPRRTCLPPTGSCSSPTPPAGHRDRAEEGEDGSHENHNRSVLALSWGRRGTLWVRLPTNSFSPVERRGVGAGHRRQHFPRHGAAQSRAGFK